MRGHDRGQPGTGHLFHDADHVVAVPPDRRASTWQRATVRMTLPAGTIPAYSATRRSVIANSSSR